METPGAARPKLQFGPFEIDAAACELREDGQIRNLAAQPFRVLLLLTVRRGEIVTRQEIRHCLWGDRKYVEADRGINFCVNQIRSALRDPAESARYIKTIPRRGYTFIAPVIDPTQHPVADLIPQAVTAAQARVAADAGGTGVAMWPSEGRRWPTLMAAVVVGCCALLLRDAVAPQPKTRAVVKNGIVVTHFSNVTGDPAFDAGLEEVLRSEIRQTPDLQVMPDATMRQTMKLMDRPADQPVTLELAHEICVRSGSNGIVEGTVSGLGPRYVVGVRALACQSGAVFADRQLDVSIREDVPVAVRRAAASILPRLGESLPSLADADVPAAVTTGSLDALQSYSEGILILKNQGDLPSIAFFKRALELDPLFAMADAALAARYSNLGQPGEALGYATKAYAQREHVSERERLLISTRYLRLRGELEKLTQVLEMWTAEFPRDGIPHGSLGVNYTILGQFAKALPEYQEALRLSPDDVSSYDNIATLYVILDRPNDAKVVLDAAFARRLDSAQLRLLRYEIAFIDKDDAQMQRQLDWAAARPGSEGILLSAQSNTEAYHGQLAAARGISRRAADAASRADYPESAALWQINAALREAEFGESQDAIEDADQALARASGRNVKVLAALAFARAGDPSKAVSLVQQIEREYAADTIMTVYCLPVIRAAIALAEGTPRLAIAILEPVRPYDMARPSPAGMASMYSTFLRAKAYLAIGARRAATLEIQKIMDHPGCTLNAALEAVMLNDATRNRLLLGSSRRVATGAG